MKSFWKYFTREKINTQGKSRNKQALDCLRALAFGSVEIRKALIELNRVKVKELSKQDGVSAATIYNAIRGSRMSRKAVELIAKSLDLSVEDLFSGIIDDQR